MIVDLTFPAVRSLGACGPLAVEPPEDRVLAELPEGALAKLLRGAELLSIEARAGSQPNSLEVDIVVSPSCPIEKVWIRAAL